MPVRASRVGRTVVAEDLVARDVRLRRRVVAGAVPFDLREALAGIIAGVCGVRNLPRIQRDRIVRIDDRRKPAGMADVQFGRVDDMRGDRSVPQKWKLDDTVTFGLEIVECPWPLGDEQIFFARGKLGMAHALRRVPGVRVDFRVDASAVVEAEKRLHEEFLDECGRCGQLAVNGGHSSGEFCRNFVHSCIL